MLQAFCHSNTFDLVFNLIYFSVPTLVEGLGITPGMECFATAITGSWMLAVFDAAVFLDSSMNPFLSAKELNFSAHTLYVCGRIMMTII